eukprot:SAG22_NODE_6020_length_914_cov_2.484663_1_plen_153_part_01
MSSKIKWTSLRVCHPKTENYKTDAGTSSLPPGHALVSDGWKRSVTCSDGHSAMLDGVGRSQRASDQVTSKCPHVVGPTYFTDIYILLSNLLESRVQVPTRFEPGRARPGRTPVTLIDHTIDYPKPASPSTLPHRTASFHPPPNGQLPCATCSC